MRRQIQHSKRGDDTAAAADSAARPAAGVRPWGRTARIAAARAGAAIVLAALTMVTAAAYLGPDRVLADGQLVSRDPGQPLNALPVGTPVTVTASLPTWATWAVPVLLDTYDAVVGRPWLDAGGTILGYVVTCTDPDCAGQQKPVALAQIVGAGRDGRTIMTALLPG